MRLSAHPSTPAIPTAVSRASATAIAVVVGDDNGRPEASRGGRREPDPPPVDRDLVNRHRPVQPAGRRKRFFVLPTDDSFPYAPR
jgi:hypothetical protein